MSRRKTKPENIQNPEHYFNRYIAKETLSDLRDTKEYYDFFDSLDALAEEGNLERRLASSAEDTFEQHMENASFYAWIDQIEDERLHAIIRALPEKQKKLLTLRYHNCLSQDEVSKIMGQTQQYISRSELGILHRIKKLLKNGCENCRF